MQPYNYDIGSGNLASRVLQGAQFGQNLATQAENRQIRQDANARANAAEARNQELFPLQREKLELSLRQAEIGLQQQQQQIDAQRAMQERKQRFQQGFGDLIRKGPQATAQDFQQFNAEFPEMAAETMKYYEQMAEERKKPLVNALAQSAVAIRNGHVEQGLEIGRQFVEAARESGDTQLADIAEATLSMATANPNAGFAQLGVLLQQINPELAGNILEKTDSSEPAEVRSLRIRAEEAGLKPATEEYKTFMLTNGAPEKAANLGPNVKGESDLRKEFAGLPVVKDFSKVNDAYSRIQASADQPDAAGDLALIFNYMKMLDPGSVVRESEFATAQNAAGVPDRIRARYNSVLSGERLADAQRGEFVARAEKLFAAQKGNYDNAARQYRELATEYGYSPDRIVKEESQTDTQKTSDEDFINEIRNAVQSGKKLTAEQRNRLVGMQRGQ